MKRIIMLLFFFNTIQGFSQQHDYYVFLVKGEVLASKPGENAVLISQNSFLDNDESIIIKKNAEVTLAGKNQDYYVLRTPGTFKVNKLGSANADPIPGVTKAYLKLVWNELFHPHDDFKTFAKDNNATAYGGVSRGIECNNLIFPVPDLKTSADSLHFIWHQTSPSSNYSLIVYDNQRKEVVNMPVKDTQQVLNLTQNIHSPGNYYWLVKAEDGTCEDEVPVVFELLTKEIEQQIISSILSGNNNDDDLPGELQAINKLEKNGLIPAASEYYLKLVDGNAGNEALLKSYVLFLLKYGYDEKAYAAWQKIPVSK